MNEQKSEKTKNILRMNAYSAGEMLNGAIGQLTNLYYMAFLLMVVKMPPLLAGIVVAVGRIWDGITDPIMGVIVDRTRTKHGSCRPYFLIAALPIFIGNLLIWSAWGITSHVGQFFYFVFAYMFYTTALTIGLVPYESLLPKIVDSYGERRKYSNLRMIYSGVVCAGVTYLYELIVPVTKLNPLSPAFQSNFTTLGLVLGAIFCVPLVIVFFGTRERAQGGGSLEGVGGVKEKINLKQVFTQYKQVLSSKTYRKYYSLALLGVFVSNCVLSVVALFVYLLYGNIQNFFLVFPLIFVAVNIKGACEIAFFVPNMLLMKKYNKHRPYLVDLPLIVGASIIGLFFSPSMPIGLFLAAMALLGAGTSCLNFVPLSLLPDLTDVDELIHGKRREGVNAGLNTLGKKAVAGFSVVLLGLFLGAFGLDSSDLTASAQKASGGALLALKIMFSVLPIIACAAMIIISRSYKLDKARHDLIKRLIQEKREKGFVNPTEDEKRDCELLTGRKYETLWVAQ
jgi:oligogalacturonide transporter